MSAFASVLLHHVYALELVSRLRDGLQSRSGELRQLLGGWRPLEFECEGKVRSCLWAECVRHRTNTADFAAAFGERSAEPVQPRRRPP